MSGVLVVAETRRGELREVSLELLGAALGLKERAGGRVACAVIGADAAAHSDALGVPGVDEVLTVQAPSDGFEAHVNGGALEALIEQERPSLVLLGHTIDALGFGPALAARLGLGFASDVTALGWEDGPVATRGAYGGKVEVEVDFPGKETTLLMLRAGAFEAPAETGEAPVREVDAAAEPRTEQLGFREVEAGDVDITQGRVPPVGGARHRRQGRAAAVRGAGRGDGSHAQRVAAAGRRRVGLECPPGRPVREDRQAARLPRARRYRARYSTWPACRTRTRSSRSTPPRRPIFRVAHYGAVADLFDVADELADQFGG